MQGKFSTRFKGICFDAWSQIHIAKQLKSLFNLCGHGHFDMQAYSDYAQGKLQDQQYDEQELAMALSGLPSVPAAA